MKNIKNILVQLEGQDEPVSISTLEREDYEGFLEFIHQLRMAYISVIVDRDERGGTV